MALRVWLPLNGTLENKGISEITLSSGTPTYTNGKIGQCLNTGTLTFNLPTNFINNISTTKQYSICCWCKDLDTAASTRWVFMLGSNTGSSRGLWESNSTTNRHWAYSGTGQNMTTSINTIDGQWHHIVFTVNNDEISLYVDGIFQSKITSTATAELGGNNTFQLNATSYNFNDFRIYDHCLSPLEVKEISQGLVLHYKLDNQYSESTVNYLTGKSEDFVGKWGSYGFGSHGTLTDGGIAPALSGQAVLVTNNAADTTNVATELATTFNSNQTTIMNKGESFTASCYVKGNGTTIGKRIHIHLYNTNGTNTLSTGKDYTLTNEWQRITYTLTWTYDTASTNSGNCYVVGYISTGESFYVSNWQVEKKDHVTPYTSTSRDGEIIDSSGYGNNGTIIGSIIAENNSIDGRYETSIKFDENADSITLTPFLSSGQTLTEFTTSIWGKTNTLNSTAPNPMSLGENAFWRFRIASASSVWYYIRVGSTQCSTTYSISNKNLIDNNWHHYAITFKNGIVIFYVDGVQIGTTDHSATATYITCAGVGSTWHLAGYAANSENWIGNLADARIYTTALSAEDIATLYHTPTQIDNLGGLHTFELEEKNGNVFAGSFLNGTMTYDATNKYYVITSNTSTSTWGIGPAVGTSPKKLIPWGMSYRLTFEVYTPTAATWYIDYNNNDVNTTLSGNDNDTGRIATGIAVPANQWTLITYGCSNTNETKNPDHLTLYDYSTGLGPVMTNITEPITWYMRNPQWYLVDTDNSTSYQAKKNGQFKGNFFKQDNLLDRASWRNNEKAIWATEFIEK